MRRAARAPILLCIGSLPVTRVFAEDPDLGARLGPEERALAGTLAVRVAQAERGGWNVGTPSPEHGVLGLLVLDGLLARRIVNGRVRSAELLGPGDVLRPWQDPPTPTGCDLDADWKVLDTARFAVLDRRFARATARWPGVTEVLLERGVQRSRRLAFQLAACALPRLDERIPALLAHLAEWLGTRTPEGLHLPMRLDHDTIADIAGARRPSVSVSLGRLRRSGQVRRMRDGSWLVTP